MFAGISRSSKNIFGLYLHCTEQVQHRSCRGQPWCSAGHFLCMWQSRPNLYINNSANFAYIEVWKSSESLPYKNTGSWEGTEVPNVPCFYSCRIHCL